jgi:hypothetical protein
MALQAAALQLSMLAGLNCHSDCSKTVGLLYVIALQQWVLTYLTKKTRKRLLNGRCRLRFVTHGLKRVHACGCYYRLRAAVHPTGQLKHFMLIVQHSKHEIHMYPHAAVHR